MKKEERDLNFKKLFYMYVKKWWIIVVTGLACMLFLGGFIKIKTPQPYTQVIKKVIITNADRPSTQGIYEIQNTMQRSFYRSMLGSQKFMEALCQNLNFDITPDELQQMISVQYTEDTAVFEITVSNIDRNVAVEVADKLVDVSRQYLENNMSVTDFYFFLLDSQETEVYSSTNVKKAAVVGGIVGILGSIVVLFILFICNKKINDEDDIEYYLDMKCLGKISHKRKDDLRFVASEILLKYNNKQIIALGGFGSKYYSVEKELTKQFSEQGRHVLFITKRPDIKSTDSQNVITKSADKLFEILEYDDTFNLEASMPELKNSYDIIVLDLVTEKNLARKLKHSACADAVVLMITQRKESAEYIMSLKSKFEDCNVKFADAILVDGNRKDV